MNYLQTHKRYPGSPRSLGSNRRRQRGVENLDKDTICHEVELEIMG